MYGALARLCCLKQIGYPLAATWLKLLDGQELQIDYG
ncbi:hypothetical protein ACVWXL_009233 [Bradyrhizobium sp. GM22.5]